MKKNITIVLFPFCVFAFMSCEETNVTRSSDNIPYATANQIEKWALTNETLLGIRANDPEDGQLSTLYQSSEWYISSYIPYTKIPSGFSYGKIFSALSEEKQNIGGTLNRYGSHSEDNNSNDINLWMVLFSVYHQYYNQVESYKNEDWLYPFELIGPELQCEDRDTDVPFLLGEIAVPNNFLDNNFFFRRSDDDHCESGLFLHQLDTFGMYGVVTTDRHHGDVPEVHPAQQIWFRNKNIFSKNKSGFWLLFIQDASNRFPDWAGSPVYGQYQIAFRVNPGKIKPNLTRPLTMNISIGDKTDLVTSEYSDQRRDCDNGTSHSLIVDGKKILTVNESGGDDYDMGIQFIDITKLRDGTIQGFVQVSMVIGDFNTNAFGMSILSLVITQPQNMVMDEDMPIKEN